MTLRLKRELRVPVDAGNVSSDTLAAKSLEEIAKLELWEGNRRCLLCDVFEVEGKSGRGPDETSVCLVGDLSKVRRIGSGMTGGEVTVKGNVGMHAGEEMEGGKLVVNGDAGSWLGTAMKGGMIEVEGNVGDYIGGIHRGDNRGMQGGTILVRGNAGVDVGSHMRGGLIRVSGNAGQFAGIHMKEGTIVVRGNVDGRAGACMTGGKIVLCGYVSSVLPTFTIDDVKEKVKAEGEELAGPFYVFVGDLAEHGSGKLYVATGVNVHLKSYETLL